MERQTLRNNGYSGALQATVYLIQSGAKEVAEHILSSLTQNLIPMKKKLIPYWKKLKAGLPWLAGTLLIITPFSTAYWFNLLEAWLPHLLIFSLLWAVSLAWKRRGLTAIFLLISLLPGFAFLQPVLQPEEGHKTMLAGPAGEEVRFAQLNLLMSNDKHEELIQAAINSSADVLAFQEVNALWLGRLDAGLREAYPYRIAAPNDHHYGMALYSRQPLHNVEILEWEGYPAIACKLRSAKGKDTLIISLHAASPISAERYHQRNVQLAKAGVYILEQQLPTVLLGDFNTVPWDEPLRKLKLQAGLTDSRAGYAATWPSALGKLGIPIDYILHSQEWDSLQLRKLPIPGSDHSGLIATLAYQPLPTENTLQLP